MTSTQSRERSAQPREKLFGDEGIRPFIEGFWQPSGMGWNSLITLVC